MKKLIKTFVINAIALQLTAEIIPTVSFSPIKTALLGAAVGLTVFEYFLKPIAKVLFLPINLLTLGLLRWVINVIGLYLVASTIQGFTINPYYFPGFNWKGIVLPAIQLSLLMTYILVSLIINLIVTIFRWLFK